MPSLSERLTTAATSYDGEASMLDHEFPEPDDYCSSRGGDSARATAAMLRSAAAVCAAVEAFQAAKKALAELHREVSSVANGYDDDYYKTALWHANNEVRATEARLLEVDLG